jgi:uncharacterized membrane protein YciS (DUF1049 family)
VTYERVDLIGKALLATATLLAIAMGACLMYGWIIAGGVLFVGTVTSVGLMHVALKELRRQMREHNLTIVTVKLDRAIRDLDQVTA